jgi:hypothetical protein
MTFAILGGGQLDTGYTIDNSLRFNDGSNDNLQKNFGTLVDPRTFTLSFWLKRSTLGTTQRIIEGALTTDPTYSDGFLEITSGDQIRLFSELADTTRINSTYTPLLRDTSAWYHIVLSCDTDQATASDRNILYINNTRYNGSANPSLSAVIPIISWTSSWDTKIGQSYGGSNDFDGYLAEFCFVEGQQLDPTSFGEFDEDSGIWKPIDVSGLTFGTNGFYLDFENSGSLGADVSGNGNNFTVNNLTSIDQTTDTPTNNFATLNPLDSTSATLSEGNLKAVVGTTLPRSTNSTISVSQGKWYFEVKITTNNAGNFGVLNANYNGRYYDASTNPTPYTYTDNAFYSYAGGIRIDGSLVSTVATYTTGDIMGVALNIDDDEITFYKNGSSQGTFSKTFSGNYKIGFSHGSGSGSTTYELNTGNPSFSISSGNSDDNGYGNFEYAPPTGFLALCTQNLATELEPTIDDGSEYFNTILWTGDGSNPRSLTGVGFQPDWLWTKARNAAFGHNVYDSSRGDDGTAYYRLETQDIASELAQPPAGHVTSLDSDGFSVTNGSSSDNIVNNSGTTYVAWNWLVNGGSTSSNTDGDVTSTVQVNSTAGFSIVTWTSTGGNESIGHGLGVVPAMFITKNRSASANWKVYHHKDTSAPETNNTSLNKTDPTQDDINAWNDTAPTSTTFTVGIDAGSGGSSGNNMVAYCFAEIEGYSKFGSYTGNGSTDGTFIYTGFRPAWVMIKRTDSANNWGMYDNKRSAENPTDDFLRAEGSNTENSDDSAQAIDFLSNGIKIRNDNNASNSSGGTYIYMCFASQPFVSSAGVPVVAR